jgi:flagellar hook-basal body complex protein FliE
MNVSTAGVSINSISIGDVSSSLGTLAPALGTITPFSGLFNDAVQQVNTLESQAHSAVEGLMTGTGVDVHQAVISTQKAEMAFEFALSVRNKAVQAYQSVMGMQF